MKTMIVFCLILAASSAAEPPYMLSLQWPPAYCSTRKCKEELKKETKFLLHGLWPYRAVGSPPCPAPKYPFDENAVSSIPDIATAWPSLIEGKPNEDFWLHEWNEHGGCIISPPMKSAEFFTKGVALFKAHIVAHELKKAGIEYDKPLRRDKFIDNMKNVNGLRSVSCRKSGKKTNDYMVVEVKYCVNKGATDIEPCDKVALGINCPHENENDHTITLYKSIVS